jgi:hypothetical protein
MAAIAVPATTAQPVGTLHNIRSMALTSAMELLPCGIRVPGACRTRTTRPAYAGQGHQANSRWPGGHPAAG